jgi:hypothetical protein
VFTRGLVQIMDVCGVMQCKLRGQYAPNINCGPIVYSHLFCKLPYHLPIVVSRVMFLLPDLNRSANDVTESTH